MLFFPFLPFSKNKKLGKYVNYSDEALGVLRSVPIVCRIFRDNHFSHISVTYVIGNGLWIIRILNPPHKQ